MGPVKIPRQDARPELEGDLMRRIRSALSRERDVVILRNNVGALRDERGVKVTYGLGVGSADLVGSLAVHVRGGFPAGPDAWSWHDGLASRWIARSLAVEVKRPGEKPTPEQVAWQEAMRRAGWVVGICTSPEEALDLIRRARRWEV